MISQYTPLISEEDKQAVIDYISQSPTPWLTEHSATRQLESALCNYLDIKYCSMTTSGTMALVIALLAVGVKAGDEVIIPDLTMLATANAVKLLGAHPVMIDINLENYCMDLSQIQDAITDKTKAVIYVTLNGRIDKEFVKCKQLLNIPVIEDSAQSLGSELNGKKLGTFGDIGCFSFSSQKIISSGQGGCIVTDNKKYAERIKQIKDFGRTNKFNYNSFGINSKFTDLQAVVLLSQLKDIANRIEKKKWMYEQYYYMLAGIVGIEMIRDFDSAPWFIDIYSDNRDGLQKKLLEKGIETRAIYNPISSYVFHKDNHRHCTPNAEYISKRGLWLPSSIDLRYGTINSICEGIK